MMEQYKIYKALGNVIINYKHFYWLVGTHGASKIDYINIKNYRLVGALDNFDDALEDAFYWRNHNPPNEHDILTWHITT